MSEPGFNYRRLTVNERLRLVGDIWDSIAEEEPRPIPTSCLSRTRSAQS